MGSFLQLPQAAWSTQRKNALRSSQRKAIRVTRNVPQVAAPYRDSLARLSDQMTIVILGHSNVFLEIADQVLRLEGGKLADAIEA